LYAARESNPQPAEMSAGDARGRLGWLEAVRSSRLVVQRSGRFDLIRPATCPRPDPLRAVRVLQSWSETPRPPGSPGPQRRRTCRTPWPRPGSAADGRGWTPARAARSGKTRGQPESSHERHQPTRRRQQLPVPSGPGQDQRHLPGVGTQHALGSHPQRTADAKGSREPPDAADTPRRRSPVTRPPTLTHPGPVPLSLLHPPRERNSEQDVRSAGHQQPGGNPVELADVPANVNARKKVPNVDGARIPVNSRPITPCRSRSRSSIESGPATMPATTAATCTAAFGLGTVNTVRAVSCRPQRRASPSTGTNPTDDTKSDHRRPPTSPTSCERVASARCPSSLENSFLDRLYFQPGKGIRALQALTEATPSVDRGLKRRSLRGHGGNWV